MELNERVLHEKLPEGQELLRHQGDPLEEVLWGGVLEPFDEILAKDISGDVFSRQLKVLLAGHHEFLAINFFWLGQFRLWDEILDLLDLSDTLWFGYQERQVYNRPNQSLHFVLLTNGNNWGRMHSIEGKAMNKVGMEVGDEILAWITSVHLLILLIKLLRERLQFAEWFPTKTSLNLLQLRVPLVDELIYVALEILGL